MFASLDIEYRTGTITVEFTYSPGQKAILDRAPEDCQPGFPPEIEITKILVGKTDVTFLFDDDMYEEVETALLELA